MSTETEQATVTAYAVHAEGALCDEHSSFRGWTTDVHRAADALVAAADWFAADDPDLFPGVLTIVRADFTPQEWDAECDAGWVLDAQ